MYKSAGHNLILKDFLLTLVREILEETRSVKSNRQRRGGRTEVQHLPIKNLNMNGKSMNSDCCLCKRSGKRKQTSFSCQPCQKRLCIDGPVSCFKLFHENGMPPRKKSCVTLVEETQEDTPPSAAATTQSETHASQSEHLHDLLNEYFQLE